jgi:hypothetical protein
MEMMTMHGNIMAEVLSVLALSTNEMQERRISEVCSRKMLASFLIFV